MAVKKKPGGWSAERRKKQAQAIRKWKPWEKSTGPKSDAGKTRSSMNAYKHGGCDHHARLMNEGLKHHLEFLKIFNLWSENELLKDQQKQEAMNEKLKSIKQTNE